MMHLYETHLPVANTEIAKDFYTEIVGLPFAYRDPTRDIIFLWAASKEQGMIGLWGPNTTYGQGNVIARKCHVAFAVSFDQLLATIEKLNKHGIETFGFDGYKTREPTVIGWMPSAQIYFRDPDGHARIHQHFARSAGPQVHRRVLQLEEVDDEVRMLSGFNLTRHKIRDPRAQLQRAIQPKDGWQTQKG